MNETLKNSSPREKLLRDRRPADVRDFLTSIAEYNEETNAPIRITKGKKFSTKAPRSIIKAGKLIAFYYLNKYYTAYVISTKRTNTGLYISNRRNLLVTCLDVNLRSLGNQIILNRLYKKLDDSNYKTISHAAAQLEDSIPDFFKNLAKNEKANINISMFGLKNFKTFKVKLMKDLTVLSIKVNEARSAERLSDNLIET